MNRLILLGIALFLSGTTVVGQGTQLLRQPTVSSSHIVFVYANDLWKVERTGGDAIRLTSNEGYESLPHFSPDEMWIAFTAQYGGNTDVYVIPASGGSPKRLTWHPGGDFVQGWTPEGKVLFRSGRSAHPTQTNKFYTVSIEGGLPIALDIPRAAFGEISQDGKQVAYVPITFWDPEWRNYRGGQAMPIWITDLENKALIRTPQPTKERHLDPVWFQNQVYYLSERDYASNIWMFDPATKAEKQLTFHKKYDVKSLDAGPDGIVYEHGGYLHFLDPVKETTEQLEIRVQGDMNFARARWENVKANQLQNVRISPNGKRVIFDYRGEILTIPKENGSWRNLTNSPGVADRYPVWSPKGDKIAWFSDKSGEYQLNVSDQEGQRAKTFALPNPSFYFTPNWSPDGKYIAYTDTDYNIWYVAVASGGAKKVDTDRYAHPNRAMNPVWSPDSKWIAYARQLESHFKAAFAYNIESGENVQLTDGLADVITPVWDQGGKYLYFLASTNYGLNSGWLDMSSYDPDVHRSLYCLVLSDKEKSPKMPKSDEEDIEKEEHDKKGNSKKDKKGKSEEDSLVVVNIEKEGLFQRTIPIDLPPRNYGGLLAGKEDNVFITEFVPNQKGATLHKYDLKELEAIEFATEVQNTATSANGEHMIYKKGEAWYLVETDSKPDSQDPLTMDVKIKVDPTAEYHQIFREGWRYMRDFLYVNNVHGAPWDDIYSWYAPWIAHVRHRTDLNYVVDIMSGEVSIGHSYVAGGDMPDIDMVPIGLLGCDLVEENGFYKIGKIYTGESWNPEVKAPLHQPGLEVKEGDYLLAVNGQSLKAPTNPYSLFEHTSGRTTMLLVNNKPATTGAKEILVKPVDSESQLRNWDWIENNRKKVAELSGGKLAYVYVP
ncbi:MAG: S41 family peptidase, partial [Cyclobacteriaceae bacterium]